MMEIFLPQKIRSYPLVIDVYSYRRGKEMIINESKIINERAINLGNGASAYSYGGKYYIKKGDTKKEISKNQYTTLLNGKTADKDLEKYKELRRDQDYTTKQISNKGFDKNMHKRQSYMDRSNQLSKLSKNINDEGDFAALSGESPTSFINRDDIEKNKDPREVNVGWGTDNIDNLLKDLEDNDYKLSSDDGLRGKSYYIGRSKNDPYKRAIDKSTFKALNRATNNKYLDN